MNILITINTEDDELQGYGKKTALRRILREAVDKIVEGKDDFKLMDINGNSIGDVTANPSFHTLAAAEGYVACTGWSIEDVKGHYAHITDGKVLSDEAAGAWLDEHADNLVDVMCGRGNDFIADMLDPKELEEEEDEEEEKAE